MKAQYVNCANLLRTKAEVLKISGKATGYWRPRDRNALPLARGQSSRKQRLESKGFGGQNWHFTYSMPETHKMQELRTKWKRVKIICGVIYVQFAELKSTKDPPSVYVAIGKAKFNLYPVGQEPSERMASPCREIKFGCNVE